jgi:pimeloyl-ACP methyl ester carboxylesterase
VSGDGGVTPFRVEFGADAIADLRDRLARTRWPEAETVDDWSQGVPRAFLQHLCRYWAEEYDFAAATERLNAFPQFRTTIDGLGIHFLHRRSSHPDALPLVVTHGWPGSVTEFLEVVEPLCEPERHGGRAEDAFHVVCPSLPGYGFSDRPATTGWGLERIADAWAVLMSRLGYRRFGAQGGDWGSAVSTTLAERHADRLVGIHVNMPTVPLPPLPDDATERERAAIDDYAWHLRWGTGYSLLQATRPQTLGYGLVDSPVAQCAWIVEKFWAWTDCGGDPLSAFTEDQLLDNVTVYWMTGTGASSGRLYWEGYWAGELPPVTVPTGVSVFPREIRRPSRRWTETRFGDIRWWNEPAEGGHFAAFERPAIFVDEVRSAFRAMRT